MDKASLSKFCIVLEGSITGSRGPYKSELEEFGGKIPAEKKDRIKAGLVILKSAFESKNLPEVETAMNEMNPAWQEASQDLYAAQQEAAPVKDDSIPLLRCACQAFP